MTLVELHKIMGDWTKTTLREDLTTEQREIENEQSKIIIGIAKQMINNGKLILDYEKSMARAKNLEHSVLKDMIGD